MTDLEMMKRPSEWPKWPFLPVKRSREEGVPEVGMLVDSQSYSLVDSQSYSTAVFLMDRYKLPVTKEWLKFATKIEYESYEAIIADGWVVN